MPLWLIIIFVLLVLLLIYLAFRPARTTPASIGINNVGLTINPTQVTCGSGTQFVCTINTTGYSDNSTARNFKVELYDDETFVDLLATYNSSTVGPAGGTPGIAPTLITGSVLYTWSVSHSFNLSCNTSCNVVGPDGSSGESDPKIYSKFTVMHGNPYPTKESIRVQIKCVSAS